MKEEGSQKSADATFKTTLFRELSSLAGTAAILVGAWYVATRPDPPASNEPPRFLEVVPAAARPGECGDLAPDGRPVVISMLYSLDKQAWIERAAEVFGRRCKNIQIKLTKLESMATVDKLDEMAREDPKSLPTLWSPTDSLAVEYLKARWEARSSGARVQDEDRSPLVRSPLIMLVWEDRGNIIDAVLDSDESDDGAWMKLGCPSIGRTAADAKSTKPVVSAKPAPAPEPKPTTEADPTANTPPATPADDVEEEEPGRGARDERGRWTEWASSVVSPPKKRFGAAPPKRPTRPGPEKALATYAEVEGWGQVKVFHAMPTSAESGLSTLYLLAYDYLVPPSKRHLGDGAPVTTRAPKLADDGLMSGSQHLKADFTTALDQQKDAFKTWMRRCEAVLEEPPRSTRLLTDLMFRVGPIRYDGVVTYEHLAFPILKNVNAHEKDVKVVRVLYPSTSIVSDHPIVRIGGGDLEARSQSPQAQAAEKWVAFLHGSEMQKVAIEYGFRPTHPDVKIRDEIQEDNPFLGLRRYGIKLNPAITEAPLLDGESIKQIVDLWTDVTGRE